MDRDFSELLGVSLAPVNLRPIVRTCELESALKTVFQFDDGFEWRLSSPNEHVCYRPGDGYIGISLEHLRVGFRPWSHHFIKALCK